MTLWTVRRFGFVLRVNFSPEFSQVQDPALNSRELQGGRLFSVLDDHLKLEFLVDYWYDEGMGIASLILFKFDEDDWAELEKSCSARSVEWRIRCAHVLDLVDHEISTKILIEFLHSDAGDLVVAAADSLRSKGMTCLPLNRIEALKRLSAESSPPVRLVIEKLLSQLSMNRPDEVWSSGEARLYESRAI